MRLKADWRHGCLFTPSGVGLIPGLGYLVSTSDPFSREKLLTCFYCGSGGLDYTLNFRPSCDARTLHTLKMSVQSSVWQYAGDGVKKQRCLNLLTTESFCAEWLAKNTQKVISTAMQYSHISSKQETSEGLNKKTHTCISILRQKFQCKSCKFSKSSERSLSRFRYTYFGIFG